MSSIKRNFIYNGILSSANYIFPLLTYPYISRVLGVSNIGICNFVDNIIDLAILISMMGTTILGVREIAINKGNHRSLDNAFSSIFLLNAVFTLAALIILGIVSLTVPELNGYRHMLSIGMFKLVFNFLLFDWFFRGIEEFRYITIRSIIVRLAYVLAVFIFVRNQDDYVVYYLLSVGTIGLNAIVNCVHVTKFIHIKFSIVCCRKVLRPFMMLGAYLISNSFYTTFNVVYLGFVSNDTQVGYFTTATKIFTLILTLYGALTSVLLPRASFLLSENRKEEFRNLINKSLSILKIFAIPVIIFSFVMAPQIVRVVCGAGYEDAVVPFMIVVPIVLINGLEQVLVVQILMPLRKDKVILYNSFAGAILGVMLNVLLVGFLQSVGSSLVWILSETLILILSYRAVDKSLLPSVGLKTVLFHCIVYLPLFFILITVSRYTALNAFPMLLISFFIVIIYSIICLFTVFRTSQLFSILFPKGIFCGKQS